MKILMVSSFLPYPLVSGGNIRLYNLLKNLSKRYEVTLICEKRGHQTQKDIKEVQKFCKKVITVNRRKQWTVSNILKSAFSPSPFLIIGHENTEMKKIIREELTRNNYDLIHVETFYVMQNLPKTDIPVVLIEHNVEYLVYKRYADLSLFFLRLFLYWDIFKMKMKEESFWKKANALVAVSEKERNIMNADKVISNGVDTEKFKIQSLKFNRKDRRVLFIGDFKWLENRDAVRWIIKKIWPELKSKIDSDLKLWIVGKKIPDSIKSLTNDNDVIFDENAPYDTSLIYEKSFVLLSPIRMGGGTSFKILEAMASGVPVVTTSLGAEGITDGKELIIANNIEEIIQSVKKLFRDKKYYENISKAARKLIEEKYDWRNITKELERVYEKVAKV